MLRTDGGGQEADPAPHKTDANADRPMPADPARGEHTEHEQAEGDVAQKPTPAKSSDAGFGSFG